MNAIRRRVATSVICFLATAACMPPPAAVVIGPSLLEADPFTPHLTETGILRDPARLDRHASPNLRPNQSAGCLVAVAISGGGSNSSAFSWGVLEKYEEEIAAALKKRNIPDRDGIQEIDYLTSASGGGLTAAIVVEMLRERESRSRQGGGALPPPAPGELSRYFDSPRYRGNLDWRFLKSREQLDFILQTLGNVNAREFHDGLRIGLEGTIPREQCGAEALQAIPLLEDRYATLQAIEADPSGYRSYIECVDQPAVRQGELFVPRGGGASPTLPAWLPITTVWSTGLSVPAWPMWLGDVLGLKAYGLTSAGGFPQPIPTMSAIDAVLLSSAFPGIGPLAGCRHERCERPEGERRPLYTILADGGQSDNLALGTAIQAMVTDLEMNQAKVKEKVTPFLLVLDSGLDPLRPYYEVAPSGMERFEGYISNAVPFLNQGRRISPGIVRVLLDGKTDGMAGVEKPVTSFVRAEDVLAVNSFGNELPLGMRDESCMVQGSPLGKKVCLGSAPAKEQRPREAVIGLKVALERTRSEAEALVAIGRAAYALADQRDGLTEKIAGCIEADRKSGHTSD